MRWPWQSSKDVAHALLERACRDDEKVAAVVRKATELRRRNGFGEDVMKALGRQR